MSEENIKNALNQILYKRMSQEYDAFIEKLKHSTPEEIIKASYEKVFKEDILLIVENGELMNSDIRALLSEKYPLDGCYQKWLDEDVSYMEGNRYVPLNNIAKPIFEDAIKNMKKNPEGVIFYDHRKNKLIDTGQVCCYFNRVSKKSGLDITGQHCLRHTFATRCIEAGVSAVVLKTWLGHTDIHVTLDTYSDVFDRLNHKSVSQFEEYIANQI